MSAENEALVRRYYEDMCNRRQNDLADILFADHHEYHDPAIPGADGPEPMVKMVGIFQDGIEGQWDVQDVFAGGDRVGVRWTLRGEHNGEIMGIPPTGNDIAVEALSVHRIEGGKITETWTVWDFLGFLQQLGALPTPPEED
ncbi:MAG TPA: ester cyclase [Acidimicrobiales bacterium]|nr:ester cyclase [Acidimicrobiales bacterium]